MKEQDYLELAKSHSDWSPDENGRVEYCFDNYAIIALCNAIATKTLRSVDGGQMRQMLAAMQAGEMTVSRGVELLEMWLAGNYSDDMLPEVPDARRLGLDEMPWDRIAELEGAVRQQQQSANAFKEALDELFSDNNVNSLTELCAKIVALKAQAGEPVHQWRAKKRDYWHDSTKEEAYSRVDDEYEARTLYAAPASTQDHIPGASKTNVCPYPCGWENLYTIIVKSGAFLAKNLAEDAPVTEHQRNEVMRLICYAQDLALHGMKQATTPVSSQDPYVVSSWAYGGSTGIHDYLMSDGSIKPMTTDEAKASSRPALANLLTNEQQALRDAITQAKRAQEEIQQVYREAKARCTSHVYQMNDDGAICGICGEDGGWWCPDSPTHVCEYSDGEFCAHCGCPEERL